MAAHDNALQSGQSGGEADAQNGSFDATPGRFASRDRASRLIENLEQQLTARIMELNVAKERLQAEIEQRKRTENELHITEAIFASHEAILVADKHANIIRVNHAFSDITGYQPDEILGKNLHSVSAGQHAHDFCAEMWRRLQDDGKWSGEIWDKRKDGHIFPKWMTITAIKNKRHEIEYYVAIFSDISARKQAEEEIHNMAFYDVLTKLPNRRLLINRLGSALSASARHKNYGAILFIDLDHFKMLNDTRGHTCGDLLLKEVAVRIKSCVREIDTVARFGGDEFVVLIEAISDSPDVATLKVALIAEKIREALVQPYQLNEHEHYISPSIGISLFHGNEEPVDTLLERADLAMYQAKNAGRNAVHFFDPVKQHNLAIGNTRHR